MLVRLYLQLLLVKINFEQPTAHADATNMISLEGIGHTCSCLHLPMPLEDFARNALYTLLGAPTD